MKHKVCIALCLLVSSVLFVQAQKMSKMSERKLGRLHILERPFGRIGSGDPCGPYLETLGRSVLSFQVGSQSWGANVDDTWLVIDEAKTRPTWEYFRVEAGPEFHLFRLSKADAEKSPCLRDVTRTSNPYRSYRPVEVFPAFGNKNSCGPFFFKPPIRDLVRADFAFQIRQGNAVWYSDALKKYTWVILDQSPDYDLSPFVEIFDLGTGPGLTLVHTSRKNFEEAKMCLPPPE